jgi:hypothetical protein
VLDEDVMVLEHILTALQSIAACQQYRVRVWEKKGYLIHAALPSSDPFELSLDDLLFLRSIHPARIESLTFARSTAGGPSELLIWVLDATQPVMVVSTVAFFSATRKRKFEDLSSTNSSKRVKEGAA